jgi:hypothetical protein
MRVEIVHRNDRDIVCLCVVATQRAGRVAVERLTRVLPLLIEILTARVLMGVHELVVTGGFDFFWLLFTERLAICKQDALTHKLVVCVCIRLRRILMDLLLIVLALSIVEKIHRDRVGSVTLISCSLLSNLFSLVMFSLGIHYRFRVLLEKAARDGCGFS